MDDQRVLDKLDKIEEHMGKQEVNLARLTVSVEEHVKRTNLLEEDVEPLKRHVAMAEGVLKLLGILAGIATIILAVMKVMGR